jgi:hypothetical protein
MAAIITLREKIYTSDGPHQPQALRTIKVNSYTSGGSFGDKIIFYELLDGRTGIIPIQNIAGIYPLKDEVN